MALKTIRQQLEETQDAISKVMSGQSYEINGRSLTRANLKFLQEREEDLIKKAETYGLDTIPGSTVKKGAFGVSFGS